MPPLEVIFVEKRATRAAGLSDQAVDEHKELIGDLYLTQRYTRDQVIKYLETNLSFTLSLDQLSKATRRWGFYKQPRGSLSVQPSSNETTSQSAPSEAASNEPSCTTTADEPTDQELILPTESSKRPRSNASSVSRRSDITANGPSSPLPRRPPKRSKPRSESSDATAEASSHTRTSFADRNLAFTPSTIETGSPFQYTYDDKLSADYLFCCYRHTKAFSYYCKISIPFQYKTTSVKHRRARMLDMARTARTRRTSEVVRVMMESELEISNDPLIEEGPEPCSADKFEMCRMQSFLFHRHLALIYAHRRGETSRVQQHLDKARNFTEAFDTLGPESIDLWTLFRLQEKKDNTIPEHLLNSLKCDIKLFRSDMDHCLTHCWRTLSDTYYPNPSPAVFPGHDKNQTKDMKPTELSDLALQKSPLYLWKKSSFLFTYFWKQIQLERESFPWGRSLPTISATHFLMIVSMIVVQRSLLVSNPDDGPLELRPSDIPLYCGIIQELLYDSLFAPEHVKREFVTQFVEHCSWSPPAARKSALAREVQTYQMEALESVLATRSSRSTTPTSLSTPLKEVAASKTETSEIRRASTDNEFLNWLTQQHEQLASPNQRHTIMYVEGDRYPPSFGSSSVSSYLTTSLSAHQIYLNAIRGNPTISRSLASRSSSSSQVSGSSSLRRFKAAALNRRDQSESTLGPVIHGSARRLENGSCIIEEEIYIYQDGSPEEDGKATIRGRIGRLLKGKGKADVFDPDYYGFGK
ncbi:hypothetical protein FHETE_4716 [Fusarium heterosporum]|uniref:Clr5 domain-containing protein n=1 Tax=Fusarium heterosporum TaxID=42747 RepID=A0A8H5TIA8_FUSHE|nr:hypothetical protein FHETE_4716 [Fusarium heterosporum]